MNQIEKDLPIYSIVFYRTSECTKMHNTHKISLQKAIFSSHDQIVSQLYCVYIVYLSCYCFKMYRMVAFLASSLNHDKFSLHPPPPFQLSKSAYIFLRIFIRSNNMCLILRVFKAYLFFTKSFLVEYLRSCIEKIIDTLYTRKL